MEIFKLFGSILIDTDESDKSLSKTDSSAKKVSQSLGKGITTAAKWGAAITTAAVGAASAAGAALGKLVSDTADYADEIDKASLRSSLGAENLQRIKYAAEQSGASLENVEKSAKKLNERLGEVSEGNDKTAEMFEKLGVSVYDSENNLRSSDEVYNETLMKLADMGDTAEATAIGTDLFGKAFTDLKPLLAEGSEGIGDLMENADKLGIVMSEDAVDSGVVLGDTIADIKNALGGLGRNLGSSLIPLIQKMADKFIAYLPRIQKFIERLLPVVEKLAESIIEPIMTLMDDLFPPLMDFIEALIPPISDLISSILPVIIELFKKLLPIFTQIIEKLLPPLMKILDALLPILDIVFDLLTPILDLVLMLIDPISDVLDLLSPLISALLGLIQNILEPIKPLLDFLVKIFGETLKVALQAITPIIEALTGSFEGFAKFLQGDFLGGIESFAESMQGVFDGAFAFIDNLFGTHLSEWYAEIKQSCFNFGSMLADTMNSSQNELNAMETKYSDAYGNMLEKYSSLVKSGKTAEEAIKQAYQDVYTNAEMQEMFRKRQAEDLTGLEAFSGKTSQQIIDMVSATPALATGGVVSGSTLAFIGDNPDAAINPEVVAPINTITDIIGNSVAAALDGVSAKIAAAIGSAAGNQTIVLQLDGLELARAVNCGIVTLKRAGEI